MQVRLWSIQTSDITFQAYIQVDKVLR